MTPSNGTRIGDTARSLAVATSQKGDHEQGRAKTVRSYIPTPVRSADVVGKVPTDPGSGGGESKREGDRASLKRMCSNARSPLKRTEPCLERFREIVRFPESLSV